MSSGRWTSAPRGTVLLVADMAVDVDYKFYNIYGNSTTAVENRVNAVINAVNNQYESQTDVTHEIQAIVIRTSSSSDPYAGTNDIETLLYPPSQDDWNGGNHPGVSQGHGPLVYRCEYRWHDRSWPISAACAPVTSTAWFSRTAVDRSVAPQILVRP